MENLAPFNPSSEDVVRKTLELVAAGPQDVVYDLGCGDGRVIVELAKAAGCSCIGVEYEERYAQRAREEVERQGLGSTVEVRHMDVCKLEDLPGATIVFMYLCVQTNPKLQALVSAAHKRGARIVSSMFSLPYLGEPSQVVVCDGITKLFLYDPKQVADAGKDSGSAATAAPAASAAESKEEGEEKPWEEKSVLEKLEWMMDPLRNPAVVHIFNACMAVLGLTLALMVYMDIGGIHTYNIGVLTVCLTVSVNWFLGELRKAIEKEAAEKKGRHGQATVEDKDTVAKKDD